MASSSAHEGNQVGCVLTGDFNTAPGSALYHFLDRGHLPFASLDRSSLAGGTSPECLSAEPDKLTHRLMGSGL
jgi:hypothetical protein